MRYHLNDLIRVRKQYNTNFAKLIEASRVNSLEHPRFIKEEKRLNRLEGEIMHALGSMSIYKAAFERKL